jgi:hypothetical protein
MRHVLAAVAFAGCASQQARNLPHRLRVPVTGPLGSRAAVVCSELCASSALRGGGRGRAWQSTPPGVIRRVVRTNPTAPKGRARDPRHQRSPPTS